MIVEFKTAPSDTRKINPERRERLMQDFQEYLSGKYDYISKFQMLTKEKKMRMDHYLTIADAIIVWKRIYSRQK